MEDYKNKLKPIGSTPSYASKLKPIVSTPKTPVASDKGFVGNIFAGMVKPFARVATNLVNVGQMATGNKPTNIFSGKFLGDVKPVGVANGGGLSVENLKDAIGVGAEIATNIPVVKGAGLGYDILKGAVKEGGMGILKKAVVPIAKEGAFGGGLFAGGNALQENKSLGETALETALGAGAGALAAPILSIIPAIGGKVLNKYTNISKLFKGKESKFAKEATDQKVEDIAQYVRAPLNTAEKAKLQTEKRGTEYSGLFGLGTKKFKLGEDDFNMANAVKDIIDPRMSKADDNIDKIMKNVTQVHDNELMPFLRENPVPYDWVDLKKYMDNKMRPSELLKINKDSSNAFNVIKKKGLDILGQYPPTQEGVQQARTAIDNMINNEFGPAIWDKTHPLNTSVKEAVLKLRTTLNDFTHDSIRVRDIPAFNKVEEFIQEAQRRGMKMDNIQQVKEELLKTFGAEVLPENELKAILFRQSLKNMNLKLKAADNIWKNSAKEVGKTKLENIKKAKGTILTGAAVGGTIYGLNRLFGGRNLGSGSGNNTN